MPDALVAEPDAPLVWAVRFPPKGAPLELDRIADEPPGPDGPGWVWAHFDLVHVGCGAAIEALEKVPEPARALLLGTDDAQHLIADENMVAGVLPAFAGHDEESAGELVMWHFVLLPDLLITARRTPLRTMMAAWEGVRKGRVPLSPGVLVHELMREFAQQARREAALLSDRLEDVEETLLGSKSGDSLQAPNRMLGRARRSASHLRRAVAPMLRQLQDEETDWPAWAGAEHQDAVIRQVLATLDDLHSLQERAHILQDEISSRQNEETNRRLYLMSIVTTLVMPAALVTGYFGMNTGGMPWSGEFPLGTVLATGVMLASVVLTLVLLRARRML